MWLSPTYWAFQLQPVISGNQYYGRVIGHFDQPVDPKVRFFHYGLIGCEVAVDHKGDNDCPGGICG